MRTRDVLLGLGAIGAAVIAAKLIADARKSTVVSLPPGVPGSTDLFGQPVPGSTGSSSSTPAKGKGTTGKSGTTVRASGGQSFDPVLDCTGAMSTTQACWCWGAGYGQPECAEFDYTVFFDGQSVAQ